jgi:hypothetical protein
MSTEYENDTMSAQARIKLSLQAAVALKSLANLVACQSWLVARLALREVQACLADIQTPIDSGKPPANPKGG